ncbi:MAG: hypothetical protein IJS60_10510 [Abditibacteriota bacterium]|nr:hypothetical protein [Abditibacteriota bacterium]
MVFVIVSHFYVNQKEIKMKKIILFLLIFINVNVLFAISKEINNYKIDIKGSGYWIVDNYPDQVILSHYLGDKNEIKERDYNYSNLFDFNQKNIVNSYFKKYDNNTKFDAILYTNDIKSNKDNCTLPDKCIMIRYYNTDDNKDLFTWNLYYSTFFDKGEIKIQDIKEINNKIFIACNSRYNVYIYVLHYVDNNKNILEKYNVFPNLNVCKIKSMDLLTDNIVKLKLTNDITEYWKISQSKEDFDKNLIDTKPEIADLKKLIWSNFYKEPNQSLYQSWDYIRQESEPTVDQLKGTFPEDTFFAD